MNPPTDYPTPLTDEHANDGWTGDAVCVSAVFARLLEQRLAAARAALEQISNIPNNPIGARPALNIFQMTRQNRTSKTATEWLDGAQTNASPSLLTIHVMGGVSPCARVDQW